MLQSQSRDEYLLEGDTSQLRIIFSEALSTLEIYCHYQTSSFQCSLPITNNKNVEILADDTDHLEAC